MIDGNKQNPATSPLTAQPPPPPRPLTARSSRRSWGDRRVRPWWMASLLLTVITLYFVGTHLVRSLQDRQLIHNGLPIEAAIVEANGETLQNKVWEPYLQATFKMVLDVPGKGQETIVSRLNDQRVPLQVGQKIKLYVDRDDPSRWTDR